jgi:hypothetical protein
MSERQLQTILCATDIEHIVECVPSIGKVMLMRSACGITFERIGPVASVTMEDSKQCQFIGTGTDGQPGELHARIDSAAISSVLVDRSNVMKNKVYPRLVLRDVDNRSVLTVIGFDGLEPFDRALSHFSESSIEVDPVPEEVSIAASTSSQRVPDALSLVAGKDVPVALSFINGSSYLVRPWGPVDELRPAMGFVNIIEPDFHLHVKQGAIGWWQEEEVPTFLQAKAANLPAGLREKVATFRRDWIRLVACTPDGSLTGLSMIGERSVFRSDLWQLG